MPQGKGTYGNQVGRPSKNKSMANGDPKKKKSVKANMPSVDVKAEDRTKAMTRATKKHSDIKGEKPYSKTERKEHVPQTVRDKRPNFEAKTKSDADRVRSKYEAKTQSAPKAPERGPRSEGPRGKGTGWAN